MNLMKVEQYAEKEILSGRSHQEIFNEVAAGSEYKIHDIAEALRKIVSPAKRQFNKNTNYVLAGVMALLTILELLGMISEQVMPDLRTILFLAARVVMVVGVIKYWKNIYKVCLVVLWANLVAIVFEMVMNFDWMHVPALFFLLNSIVICFYLNVKTCTDYRLNRELLEKNPGARENAVLFDQ